MPDVGWTWSVQEVFTIEGRGVVVVGPLSGPFPTVGDLALIEHEGRERTARVAGLNAMRVRGGFPFSAPVLRGRPVGLVLTGVAKAEVPVGAIVRGTHSGE